MRTIGLNCCSGVWPKVKVLSPSGCGSELETKWLLSSSCGLIWMRPPENLWGAAPFHSGGYIFIVNYSSHIILRINRIWGHRAPRQPAPRPSWRISTKYRRSRLSSACRGGSLGPFAIGIAPGLLFPTEENVWRFQGFPQSPSLCSLYRGTFARDTWRNGCTSFFRRRPVFGCSRPQGHAFQCLRTAAAKNGDFKWSCWRAEWWGFHSVRCLALRSRKMRHSDWGRCSWAILRPEENRWSMDKWQRCAHRRILSWNSDWKQSPMKSSRSETPSPIDCLPLFCPNSTAFPESSPKTFAPAAKTRRFSRKNQASCWCPLSCFFPQNWWLSFEQPQAHTFWCELQLKTSCVS